MTSLELRKFVAPEFVFGVGARNLAGQHARNFGAYKALVVTNPDVMAAGWMADVTASLEASQISFTLFSQVTPNPRAEEVMTGVELYKQHGCQPRRHLTARPKCTQRCLYGHKSTLPNQRDIEVVYEEAL